MCLKFQPITSCRLSKDHTSVMCSWLIDLCFYTGTFLPHQSSDTICKHNNVILSPQHTDGEHAKTVALKDGKQLHYLSKSAKCENLVSFIFQTYIELAKLLQQNVFSRTLKLCDVDKCLCDFSTLLFS